MARQLLVLRHAKSAWDTNALSDFERPLAKRGKKDAPRVGAWMRAQGLIPDQVLGSPARRARQTVERVCAELGLDANRIIWESSIYAAGTGALLGALATCPRSARVVLVVGHNPGLEELLRFLTGGANLPFEERLLPTGALAELAMPDDWAALPEGCATLRRIVRPKDLPAAP